MQLLLILFSFLGTTEYYSFHPKRNNPTPKEAKARRESEGSSCSYLLKGEGILLFLIGFGLQLFSSSSSASSSSSLVHGNGVVVVVLFLSFPPTLSYHTLVSLCLEALAIKVSEQCSRGVTPPLLFLAIIATFGVCSPPIGVQLPPVPATTVSPLSSHLISKAGLSWGCC